MVPKNPNIGAIPAIMPKYADVFFQFGYFQLANVFNGAFNIFNWPANTQQTFLQHTAQWGIAVAANSDGRLQVTRVNAGTHLYSSGLIRLCEALRMVK